MSTTITWKWIEESFFPLVVRDAQRAGMNTEGWALDARPGPGRALVKLNPDGTVADVYLRFDTPRQADLVLQGMRWAWSRCDQGEVRA